MKNQSKTVIPTCRNSRFHPLFAAACSVLFSLVTGAAQARVTDGHVDDFGRITDSELMYEELPGSSSLAAAGTYEWPEGGVQDFEIPAAVRLNGVLRPVTVIAANAFYPSYSGNNEINGKLVIPQSVTLIKESAFHGNPFTEVSIPESVIYIQENAFTDCDKLRTIKIPSRVTSIADGAFRGCDSLESITFHRAIKSIGSGAFASCSVLSNIELPAELGTLGSGAFDGCSSLRRLVIPGKVSVIGDNSFANCAGLETVVIPGSVSSIDSQAFYPCVRLRQVTFLGSLPSLYYSFPTDNPRLIEIRCFPQKGFESVFDDKSHYQIQYIASDLAVFTQGGKQVRNNGKSLYLGTTQEGRRGSTATLIIRNNGIRPLYIRKVRLAGAQRGNFKILSLPAKIIAPGKSAKLRVRLQPAVVGTLNSVVEIVSNDPFEKTFRLRLSGKGR